MEMLAGEDLRLAGVIIIMIGLLGINYLIVKEETVKKKIKLGVTTFVIGACFCGVFFLNLNVDDYNYGVNSEYFKENSHLYDINY